MNYWNDFYRFLLAFILMVGFTACGGDGLGKGAQYDPEGFVRYEGLGALLKVRGHASKTPPDCDAIGKEGDNFQRTGRQEARQTEAAGCGLCVWPPSHARNSQRL